MSESDYIERIKAMERRLNQLQVILDALTVRVTMVEQSLAQNWATAGS